MCPEHLNRRLAARWRQRLAGWSLALCGAVAAAADVPPISAPTPPVLGDPPPAPKVQPLLRAPAAALALQALPPGGLAINTQDREAVRNFYRGAYFLSEDVPMGWSGNYAAGNAGATAQAFRDAVSLRVNWFRAMAGIPAGITLFDGYNLKDQDAALMMSANNQLSHMPPGSWLYYTAGGAEAAANSNLSLGNSGAQSVTFQMQDPGAGNAPLGHRRWLLFPQTQRMGSGDVPGGTLNGAGVLPANALWVLDGNFGAPRPATRDGFVAWPPPGHAPYPLVFGRWSFSYPGANFAAATVAVSKGGVALPVNVVFRADTSSPNFGERTIVWLVNGATDTTLLPRPATDEHYQVTISGVQGSGVPSVFNYTVVVFDHDVATPGAPQAIAAAPAAVSTTVPFAAAVSAMPGATGYDLDLYRAGALGGALTPANSASFWTALTSGYNALEAGEFHLYHPAFAPQQLALNKALFVGQNASLSFERRFNFASPDEIARVQVSLDGGVSWQDIHTEAGTSNAVPYSTITLGLSPFVGRMIRLRFLFTVDGAFFTCGTCGWFFRNIAFNNVSDLALVSHTVLSPALPSANLVAATAGNYVLLARAEYQGSYFGDWGPGTAITAAAQALSAPTGVSLAAGIGSITLHFAAPANNGGSAVTGYAASCTSSNGGVAGANSGGAAATAITVSGLSAGRRYTCTVSASNAAGTGPASAPGAPVTPLNIVPLLELLLSD